MTGLHDKLELARIKMTRYRILKTLDVGRPYPVGDGLLVEILNDADLNVTKLQVRRALQYLQDKGFVEVVEPKGASHWEARLLPAGIDYVEDTTQVDSGISRPDY